MLGLWSVFCFNSFEEVVPKGYVLKIKLANKMVNKVCIQQVALHFTKYR